jgi:hypothetical protein
MTLLGARVIVKSNEDDPAWIGRIKTMQILGQACPRLIPVVICEETEEEFLCFAAIALYTDELWESLKGLSVKEQYKKVCDCHCPTPLWKEQKEKAMGILAVCQTNADKAKQELDSLSFWQFWCKGDLVEEVAYWNKQVEIWLQKTKKL